MALVSCLYLPADKSYYKIIYIFGRAVLFSTSRGKWKVVKICTLSPSIDGHLYYISFFLLTKLLQNIVIFGCEFRFLTTRVNMEGCERCTLSPSIEDTGLMSLSVWG